jgi:Leucine-rich repeat (LRR) protein
MNRLKNLNLENCKIRDRGAIELMDGLKLSSRIVNLNLSRNDLSDQISKALY